MFFFRERNSPFCSLFSKNLMGLKRTNPATTTATHSHPLLPMPDRKTYDTEIESESSGSDDGDEDDDEDDVDAAFREYLSPARVLRRMSGIEAPAGIQEPTPESEFP